MVQPRFLISKDVASHRAFGCGQAKPGQSVTSTPRATPKRGSPSLQPKGPHQSVGVHGEDEQKKSEKGWKWVKMGENQKMPYPRCGRNIKTYAGGKNDAPSITKYGSPVRLDAQIVALRAHCAKGAPKMMQRGCKTGLANILPHDPPTPTQTKSKICPKTHTIAGHETHFEKLSCLVLFFWGGG